jgi:probable HAF family extracellular repeat protein
LDLGALPGRDISYGYALNNNGQVVGASMVPPVGSGFSPYHAFLYSGQTMTDLGTVPAYGQNGRTQAYGINDNGWVVGLANPQEGGRGHAFLYANGTMTDIGAPWDAYGYYSQANGVNNAGQVVGTAYPKSGGGSYAFLYVDGNARSLGSLGSSSVAYAINSAGEVVGSSVTFSGFTHPFLYTKSRMIDLTALVVGTNPFTQLQVATAINDNGYIAGYGAMPDGSTHAFLATPGSMKRNIGYVPYLLLLLD